MRRHLEGRRHPGFFSPSPLHFFYIQGELQRLLAKGLGFGGLSIQMGFRGKARHAGRTGAGLRPGGSARERRPRRRRNRGRQEGGGRGVKKKKKEIREVFIYRGGSNRRRGRRAGQGRETTVGKLTEISKRGRWRRRSRGSSFERHAAVQRLSTAPRVRQVGHLDRLVRKKTTAAWCYGGKGSGPLKALHPRA
jgi:hypothetical protein